METEPPDKPKLLQSLAPEEPAQDSPAVSWDEAEENRLRVKEEIHRMLHKLDGFNHW